jgi:hypothetical protein
VAKIVLSIFYLESVKPIIIIAVTENGWALDRSYVDVVVAIEEEFT